MVLSSTASIEQIKKKEGRGREREGVREEGKEGRKEGRKEQRKEERKEGTKGQREQILLQCFPLLNTSVRIGKL
jgi:hypothetical protein